MFFTAQYILYNMVRSVARVCSERNVLQKNAYIFVGISHTFSQNFAKMIEAKNAYMKRNFAKKIHKIIFAKISHFVIFSEIFAFFRETDWSEILRIKLHFSQANEMQKLRKFSRNDYSISLQTLSVAPWPPPHMLVIILICIFYVLWHNTQIVRFFKRLYWIFLDDSNLLKLVQFVNKKKLVLQVLTS